MRLETLLNERRKMLGRDPAFLHVHRCPLAEACAMQQLDLINPLVQRSQSDMVCESGHCMT